MTIFWVGEIRFTFPAPICSANSRYSYVKVERHDAPVANEDVTLAVTYGSESISLVRKTDASGVVVFPLQGVLQALCGDSAYIAGVMFNVAISDTSVGIGSHYVINGHGDREIELINMSDTPSGWPQLPRLVIYPMFTQDIFVPAKPESAITLRNGDAWDVTLSENSDSPFVTFDPSMTDLAEGQYMLTVDATADDATYSFPLVVDVDPCTDGIFLRWIDKHGMPYLYRWTSEIETTEMEVSETYMRLDADLMPYETQIKNESKTVTLHSRLVDADIYALCKTILSARSVEMFNAELSTWERCYISEGNAEDAGEILKDLVVDVVKTEYNL